MVAVMNYDLCPGVTLDGTVASALTGLEWVAKSIAWHGGDPARITLSGHSAGAHLVAACLATDWTARGLPAAAVVLRRRNLAALAPLVAMRPAELGIMGVFCGLAAGIVFAHAASIMHVAQKCAAVLQGARKIGQEAIAGTRTPRMGTTTFFAIFSVTSC